MNDILPVAVAFIGTTVEPDPVFKYLFNTDTPRLRATIRYGAHPQVIDSLTRTEFFELELRHYIAGYRKTLHRTFEEVRAFQQLGHTLAAGMIRLTIIRIRLDFLRNEWYELMPRFEKAAAKIERLLT